MGSNNKSLYNKEYYKKNKERVRARQREYYKENRKKLNEKAKEYYYKNYKKSRGDQKKYYEKYKDILNTKRNQRKKEKPELRIIHNFRSRLSGLINGKSRNSIKLIGCDRKHLLRHLEVQFKRGMNWENYGKVWVIDHHIPISAFNYNNKKEVAACWHFSNLKPMFTLDNIRKGKKICLER